MANMDLIPSILYCPPNLPEVVIPEHRTRSNHWAPVAVASTKKKEKSKKKYLSEVMDTKLEETSKKTGFT